MVSGISGQQQSPTLQALQQQPNGTQSASATQQTSVKGHCNPCVNCGACGKPQDPRNCQQKISLHLL